MLSYKDQSYTICVSICLAKSESKLFVWLRLLVAASHDNTYPFADFSDLISYREVKKYVRSGYNVAFDIT